MKRISDPVLTETVKSCTPSAPACVELSRALPQRPAKSAFKNFDEIGALEDSETTANQIELPKASSSKKRREKEEDESQRLKRVMAICAGC